MCESQTGGGTLENAMGYSRHFGLNNPSLTDIQGNTQNIFDCFVTIALQECLSIN
jgi:hypothetical protein